MVGSTSFSSKTRISVISSFADQPIAASCLGCQQNRVWNDRHRGGSTHHDGHDHAFDVARGIPTGYSSTVRGFTVQWPLFTFHNFEHWYLQYQYFLWNQSASYFALCVLQPAAGSCLSFALQVWVFLMSQQCCTVPPVSPATGGLSTIPPLLLPPYEYYVLYCCTALLSLPLLRC
jgi:hypothetical protein